MAPGNFRILQLMHYPRKRPPRTRIGDELPTRIVEHVPDVPFKLEEIRFLANL